MQRRDGGSSNTDPNGSGANVKLHPTTSPAAIQAASAAALAASNAEESRVLKALEELLQAGAWGFDSGGLFTGEDEDVAMPLPAAGVGAEDVAAAVAAAAAAEGHIVGGRRKAARVTAPQAVRASLASHLSRQSYFPRLHCWPPAMDFQRCFLKQQQMFTLQILLSKTRANHLMSLLTFLHLTFVNHVAVARVPSICCDILQYLSFHSPCRNA